MAFRNSILAGEELVRSGMRSPDFTTSGGTTGWWIGRNGDVIFNNGIFRGTIAAGALITGSVIIDVAGDIRSANYVAGVSGFIIRGDGFAEFNDVTARGDIFADTFSTDNGSDFYVQIDSGDRGTIGFYNVLGQLVGEISGAGGFLGLTTAPGVDLRIAVSDQFEVTANNGYLLVSASGTLRAALPGSGATARQLTPLFGRTASSLAGGGPPAVSSSTQQFYEQAGTSLLNFDAFGDAQLVFPSAFPNGLLSIVVSNGDPTLGVDLIMSTYVYAAASCFVHCRNSGGGIVSGNRRVNWIAKGW
jgi:hypothetical protein